MNISSSTPTIPSAPSKLTSNIMLLVCLALLPGIFTAFHFLGWGVLINLTLCIIYALAAEAFILKLRNKPIKETLSDNSALLTGMLLALALPPMLPWWMSFIGVTFAIIIAKQLYGGLGFNPFNPAMVGYVLLLISFPVEMTAWIPNAEVANKLPSFLESIQLTFLFQTGDGYTLQSFRELADGYTMATPLDENKTALSLGVMSSEIMQQTNFSDNLNGWLWINLSFFAGGLFLLTNRLIQWQIPVSILVGVFMTATLFYLYDDQLYLPPWLQLVTGGIMLGAFFIATDPVSAATTPKGKIIYGVSIGFIIVIIRTLGGYPDAIAFSVLLLNIAVPTIDHYTKPRVYGHDLQKVKQKKAVR
ncbi:MAG: electron transport complex subunit RsxD [Kangiellaceae bacterium]|nr:electron transport complex subunit RsxD [Kangiellaceae bacterium]